MHRGDIGEALKREDIFITHRGIGIHNPRSKTCARNEAKPLFRAHDLKYDPDHLRIVRRLPRKKGGGQCVVRGRFLTVFCASALTLAKGHIAGTHWNDTSTLKCCLCNIGERVHFGTKDFKGRFRAAP